MVASIPFLCPLDGSAAQVIPVLTNKGERQAVICETHGPLAWVGTGPVGAFGGGISGAYNASAARLDDLAPGEYGRAGSGAFAGVWAARPPHPDAAVVIVPTQYSNPVAGFPASSADPALTVIQPFTGVWRGRLSQGVWFQSTDAI